MSKHNSYTLEDKYSALMSYINKEKTIKKILIDLKVKQSTFSGWIKNKSKIIDEYERSVEKGKIRKLKQAAHSEVKKVIEEWFLDVRRKNISVSGPLLMEKANYFSILLNDLNFNANNGWLTRFKARHNITWSKRCAEAISVDQNIAQNYIKNLPL